MGASTKWIIAGSFILFGVSLIAASFFMYLFSGGEALFPRKQVDVESAREEIARDPDFQDMLVSNEGELFVFYSRLKQLDQMSTRTITWTRWGFFVPFISFISGLFCFGLAVLITVL